MRYVALTLTLVLLTVATPLAASWWPAWSQTDMQLYVDEKGYLQVTPTWSGLVDMGGIHWTFVTDNPRVVTGSVSLDSAAPKIFDVVGVGPGTAHIRDQITGWPYVTIRVVCAPEDPAVAAQPVVRAELGRDVHLTVVTQYESRAAFRWYAGNVGDTSQPLGSGSAEMVYTPASYGSHPVWAEVATTCTTTQVPFRVDVYPRQRSARH